MLSDRKTNVLILGQGCAGLVSSIYLGRAGLNPVLIAGSCSDTLIPGGQLMITDNIENYPGFPDAISGPDLIELFSRQARQFGAEFIEQFATRFEFKQGGPHRVLVNDEWYSAKAVILAVGARARWLNAINEDVYRNNGLSACATCDGPLPIYRNKKIYVVGGGDTSCQEALFLTKFASKVYIVHRRDSLRASRIMADRVLTHDKIEMVWNSEVVEYLGDGSSLTGLKLKNTLTQEITTVDCAGCFIAIGHEPNTACLRDSMLALDKEGYIEVKDNVYTNIDGVFAAGDCHDKVYRQAITAAGFGCMAAIATERWLDNNKK